MICYYTKYRCDSVVPWRSPIVNSKDNIDFAMLFTLRENLRTSVPALLRVRSKKYYDFTLRRLDSEALRPLQHWGYNLSSASKSFIKFNMYIFSEL